MSLNWSDNCFTDSIPMQCQWTFLYWWMMVRRLHCGSDRKETQSLLVDDGEEITLWQWQKGDPVLMLSVACGFRRSMTRLGAGCQPQLGCQASRCCIANRRMVIRCDSGNAVWRLKHPLWKCSTASFTKGTEGNTISMCYFISFFVVHLSSLLVQHRLTGRKTPS